MAASYLRRGMTGPATFSLFVRRLPNSRGFLVCAGVEECLDFLAGFQFREEDLRYLRDIMGMDAKTVAAFAAMRFTGDAWAVPEGRVVFAGEPILEVTAPIAEAQVVETYLLNQVTLHTTIASKAARAVIAARGRPLVDFSFRRTQGIDASMAVARSALMVGFTATSNVEAARRLDVRSSGTMAHSYIEAFDTELEAFRAYGEDFREIATFLVDTYDTVEGVRNAITAIAQLQLDGQLAIRLDSGDLLQLSRQARQLLDSAGLSRVGIFASGGVDELLIDELLSAGAPIDAFGVGTKMGVSEDAPYLDTAYKLVQYGERPIMKLSPEKTSAPGRKQVFRSTGGEIEDVIGLREEPVPAGCEGLLISVMEGGTRTGQRGALDEARERFRADLARLPAATLALRTPTPLEPSYSAELQRLVTSTVQGLRAARADMPG